MVFPDVRLRKYLEIRMADSLPYPFNISYCALIYNIFYKKQVLDSIYDFFCEFSEEDLTEIKKDARLKGKKALYGEISIENLYNDILFWVECFCDSTDMEYIKPLRQMQNQGVDFKTITKEQLIPFIN